MSPGGKNLKEDCFYLKLTNSGQCLDLYVLVMYITDHEGDGL